MKDILKDIETIKDGLIFPDNCVTFFGSARFDDSSIYCKKAYELAKNLALRNFTIITGGGGGIMKAANKGAYDAKKESFGLNIVLPHEQKINEFVTNGTLFSSLALRKTALIKNSKNFVIFPGGYGTMDELFEVFVLVQNGIKDAGIYLYGSKFFAPLMEFLHSSLVGEKAISKVDMSIFTLSDEIDEILEKISS